MCSREFRKQSNAFYKESLCKEPRKVLVPIMIPIKYYTPGMVHRPNSILIQQCNGVCNGNYKCLPIEKDLIQVPVTIDSVSFE